jgi:glycosyltransferase involved in cell wall biosynthesis
MLPQHDIYLSASLWEAGANHIVEAMACGLPVIYSRDGGSIPEYCQGRGLSFSSASQMIDAIANVLLDYETFRQQSLTYTRTIDDVVDQYVEVLCEK